MGIFIVLTIISLFVFGILFVLLIWAIKSGQLNDLETPAHRILWEDENFDP